MNFVILVKRMTAGFNNSFTINLILTVIRTLVDFSYVITYLGLLILQRLFLLAFYLGLTARRFSALFLCRSRMLWYSPMKCDITLLSTSIAL